MEKIKILGVSGSLRKDSYNTALLHAAQKLAPDTMTIETFDISPIPFYNADVQAEGFPLSVQDFGKKIQESDGLLIVTPEYNYSVPGVLKNAIDWASRLPDSPCNKKPTAIMGASPGMLGTARAQYHLRQIGVFLNLYMMNRPEVMVAKAHEAFDEKGELTNEFTAGKVKEFLVALEAWVRGFQG